MRISSVWIMMILFLGILPIMVIDSYSHSGDVLTATFTTSIPTFDGIISPGEWADADFIDFSPTIPEGGTTDARVFAKNDGTNLYLAVRIDRPSGAVFTAAEFAFDNDHSAGVRMVGDNFLSQGSSSAFIPLIDGFFSSDPGFVVRSDDLFGGTEDGDGGFAHDGTFLGYEISHPLNSADDDHDFSLSPGDTVGFFLVTNINNGVTGINSVFPKIQSAGADDNADLVIGLPDKSPVGGDFLPIETTSLILAGTQSFSWMIPLVLSGIGIGLFAVSRKSE